MKKIPLRIQHRRQEQRRRLGIFLALAAMMATAIALSAFFFLHNSIRLDESQSLFQTSRDFVGLLKTVGEDVHVPLYHIVLQFVRQTVADDLLTARLLSLGFFVATIPMTYLLGAYAFRSRKVGLFAALLVTLSPFMNWYGAEARMYTMLAFMSVAHYYLFLRTVQEGKRWQWVAMILVGILGVYTHYFFTLVLFTEALFYLLKQKELNLAQQKRLFWKLVGAGALITSSLLPWLVYVRSLGTASNTQPHLSAPASIDVFNTYAQFLFGFQGDFLNTILVSLWPLLILLSFFALRKSQKAPTLLIFFALAATVPIAMAFVLSYLKPFYLSRYLIIALPGLCIFVAWMILNYAKTAAYLVASGLLLLTSGGLVAEIMLNSTPVKENYATAVAYLEKKATTKDVIAVSAPFTVYPIEYYYKGDAHLTTLPQWDRFSGGGIPPLSAKELPAQAKLVNGASQRIFLVLSFDQGYQELIHKYYDGHYKQLSKKQFSRGLTVYEYQLRYDPPISIKAAQKISDTQTP